MSIKDLDVSDPSALTEDQLRYAHDRHLISEDEFLDNLDRLGKSVDGRDYSIMDGDELRAEVEKRVADPANTTFTDEYYASLKSKRAVIKALKDDDAARFTADNEE